ncbi:HepT-like ribonuclease domain-containing protein [Acidisoma cladoniae]|uniref:HepT-like ribonuclease domain-containing protein n=1 Tax=Acidisoma cladoniae TaxID=3040935 RepID=UPI0033133351
MPDEPWADIRGMGNRLRHAYGRISLDVIWNTVRDRLPSLETSARRALKRLKADRE